MKKFKYRMEPLLKMKEHQEKEKQKLLAAIQKKRMRQESEISEIQNKQNDVVEHKKNKTDKSFTVAEMLVCSRYLYKLKKDQLVNTELLKAIGKDEEEKRKQLLHAAQERKKYEKLKEKQQAKFYDEVKSLDEKESDETALNIFRLNKKRS